MNARSSSARRPRRNGYHSQESYDELYASDDMHVSERLRESRSEFEHLFDEESPRDPNFPRSKTMRLLTGNRGAILLAVAAGAILLLKPKLVARAAAVVPRYLPVEPMIKSLALRWLMRR